LIQTKKRINNIDDLGRLLLIFIIYKKKKSLVGNIGTKDKLEYTIICDTIYTASRIEALGKELGKDFFGFKKCSR
jgi:hypothetical protein